MPLPRMTTRRWMIAVMVLGLLLSVGIWVERLIDLASRYRQTAAAFGRREAEAQKEQRERLKIAAALERDAADQGRVAALRESAKNAHDLAEYHAQIAMSRARWTRYYALLKQKYAAAARRPWLFVPPDPPPPE